MQYYKESGLSQKQVALKFEVSPVLVSKLYCLAKRDPAKLEQKKLEQQGKERVRELVQGHAEEVLAKGKAITSCRMVQRRILDEEGL